MIPSDSESEVGVSNGELPVSKVRQSDEVEHTLDKGLWSGTGATWQGWKVFVKVSPICFPSSGQLLITQTQGQLMTWVPTCQHCWDLHHKCYGLADRVRGWCQRDKKTCWDVVVEGESLCSSLVFSSH